MGQSSWRTCCKFLAGGSSQLGGQRPAFAGVEEQLKETEREGSAALYTAVDLGIIAILKIGAWDLSVFKKHVSFDLEILLLRIYSINKYIFTMYKVVHCGIVCNKNNKAWKQPEGPLIDRGLLKYIVHS